MRYYARFLGVAVFCGAFFILGYTRNTDAITLSELIMILAFGGVEYYPQYILLITYAYMPLLLFQIFYGTYIYRHFCSASIYYFSRYCNRTIWFLKETGKLYVYGLAYLIVMLLSGTLLSSFFTSVTVDAAALPLTIYYLLIFSLFLLVTTLAVNVFSILFTSNVGFILVESAVLFGIAAFTFLGGRFIQEGEPIDKILWMLKINPFAHLVFGVHSSRITAVDQIVNVKSSSFDLDLSVLVFFALTVAVMGLGSFIVNHHNFTESNKETGGI